MDGWSFVRGIHDLSMGCFTYLKVSGIGYMLHLATGTVRR